MSTSSKRSDMPPTDPHLIEPPFRRKRRVEAGAQEGADEQVAAANGMVLPSSTPTTPRLVPQPEHPGRVQVVTVLVLHFWQIMSRSGQWLVDNP